SLGFSHFSGHAADGVLDEKLAPPDMGDNLLTLRAVHDIGDQFRFGLTLKPFLFSNPSMVWVSADEFAEWFPLGAAARRPGRGSPFLALGLGEAGLEKLEMTYHVQAGLQFGSHFGPEHGQAMRLVVGYYHGVDPRLKYATFLNSKWEFGYLGLMFSL